MCWKHGKIAKSRGTWILQELTFTDGFWGGKMGLGIQEDSVDYTLPAGDCAACTGERPES